MTKKVKKEVQIVLRKMHINLGGIGKLITVKSGYARNYLIPSNIAELSTTKTIKLIERKQKNLDLKEKVYVELCLKWKTILEQNYPYIIQKRVSEDNKIFGKVTLKQVRTLLENKTNLDLKDVIIELPEIKKIGIFIIKINLHQNVEVEIKMEVIPQ